ncbi:MAG: DUF3576 domain-containing protein [Alphaproteobacteria bacterium]
MRRFALLLIAGLGLVSLAACQYANPEPKYPSRTHGRVTYTGPGAPPRQTIFGEGGLGNLLGPGDQPGDAQGGGIGVNFYLWRAALDTVSFMPLASADPFGGVIITDWFVPTSSPAERYKLTVYILSRALRADGLRVAAFRQTRDGQGGWLDGPVDPATATALEDTILTRARQMRIAALAE